MTTEQNPITVALDALAQDDIPMHARLHVTLTNGATLTGTYKALAARDGFYAIKSDGADNATFFHVSSVVMANASIPR